MPSVSQINQLCFPGRSKHLPLSWLPLLSLLPKMGSHAWLWQQGFCLSALQCVSGQRSSANISFWNTRQLPFTLLPAHTRSLIMSWLLPGFLVSPSSCAWSSGILPILLQIPSPCELWIYRSPAKVCLIHSPSHPCKHAGHHHGLS